MRSQSPGGYVLVTRGMYEILASDSEIAAVLGHEISHCVQRDHYNVIRKQELASVGKDVALSEVSVPGQSPAAAYAKRYAEQHGATILLTALDRDAEFRADKAAEIYLARSGMNPAGAVLGAAENDSRRPEIGEPRGAIQDTSAA